MAGGRPRIPAPVARELRRAAGFGCCQCGLPIYQYHHIIPWSEENHFRPEDMMLLCPNHHDAATKGALSVSAQRRMQALPHNRRTGSVAGSLMVGQPFAAIRCGGVLLVGDGTSVTVDGTELLRLDVGAWGELEVSAQVQDESGALLAVVERNEWLSGDPAIWDMRSDHDRLKLWSSPRKIALMLDARGVPVSLRADLWHNGQLVRINSGGISMHGEGIDNAHLEGFGLVGMAIEIATADREARLVPRHGQAMLVSAENDERLLLDSLRAWQRIAVGPRGLALGLK